MTDDRRQELFQDAEPAEDGGKFRLVVGLMALLALFAVGWIAMSLSDLRGEVRSIQQRDTEIGALRAELAALKRDTAEEFKEVKDTLSGVWHMHKPAELEFMGFFASRKEDERRALLAALEKLDGDDSAAGNDDSSPPVPEDRSVSEAEEAPEPSADDTPASEGEETPEPSAGDTPASEGEEAPELSGDDTPAFEGDAALTPVPGDGPASASGVGPTPTTEDPPRPVRGTGEEEPGKEAEAQEDVQEFREYKIQPGDSLSRIARQHGVTAEALALANGITNPNRIRVGQTLKIPLR